MSYLLPARALVIVLAFLTLTGCDSTRRLWNAATGAEVTPQAVLIAGNTFNAAESVATIYIGWPRCTGSNGPKCRTLATSNRVRTAVRSGRIARNKLEAFFVSHPGQLGNKGVYDALVAAADTLQEITAANRVSQ